MRIGTLSYVNQLRHDMRRRRSIGITHAHVDDVFPASSRGEFQLGGDIKDIGREAIDARKATLACSRIRHVLRSHVSARNRPSDVGRRNAPYLNSSLIAA